MNKPHKHASLIKKWADGAEIEFWENGKWYSCYNDPKWHDFTDYRVKPERTFPETSLTDNILCSIYYNGGNIIRPQEEFLAWKRIANAAIKQYIIDTEENK